MLSHLITRENLLSWRLWVFLYLALCVGSHLAPSGSDYQGAKWGALLLVGLLWVFNLIFLTCGGTAGWLISSAAPYCGPALGLLALCVVLCGVATLMVWLVTQGLDLALGR